MTGSECPPTPSPSLNPTQAVECQEPQIQAGRGSGGQGRALGLSRMGRVGKGRAFWLLLLKSMPR